jgi:hypothetical protein
VAATHAVIGKGVDPRPGWGDYRRHIRQQQLNQYASCIYSGVLSIKGVHQFCFDVGHLSRSASY